MAPKVTMNQISVSAMDNNCYLLVHGDKALLVDAADDADALLALAETTGVSITGVATTHRHWDHVRALNEILAATGATHYAAAGDAAHLPAAVDVALSHGDVLRWEGLEFPVVTLRGHTPEGLVIEAEVDGTTNLFVGDSLFPGGVGRTESPEAFNSLFNDVVERVFDVYGDDTVIRPGHGKPTTVGAERGSLGEWRARGW